MPQTRVTPANLTTQFPVDDANMSLGGYEFYVNPYTIQKDCPTIIYKNVTKGGIYLQVYIADVVTYSLTGTFSNAGITELIEVNSYAPVYTKSIVPYTFIFHPLNISGVQVLIADYKVSYEQGDIWYIHYEFTLQEVPIIQSPSVIAPPQPATNSNPPRTW